MEIFGSNIGLEILNANEHVLNYHDTKIQETTSQVEALQKDVNELTTMLQTIQANRPKGNLDITKAAALAETNQEAHAVANTANELETKLAELMKRLPQAFDKTKTSLTPEELSTLVESLQMEIQKVNASINPLSSRLIDEFHLKKENSEALHKLLTRLLQFVDDIIRKSAPR